MSGKAEVSKDARGLTRTQPRGFATESSEPLTFDENAITCLVMSDTPLTDDQITDALRELPEWQREGDQLQRTFEFADFKAAMAFMVRAGFEAEGLGHHPEWSNVYNRVEVGLNTHSADGKITAKDVDLAAAMDRVAGA